MVLGTLLALPVRSPGTSVTCKAPMSPLGTEPIRPAVGPKGHKHRPILIVTIRIGLCLEPFWLSAFVLGSYSSSLRTFVTFKIGAWVFSALAFRSFVNSGWPQPWKTWNRWNTQGIRWSLSLWPPWNSNS